MLQNNNPFKYFVKPRIKNPSMLPTKMLLKVCHKEKDLFTLSNYSNLGSSDQAVPVMYPKEAEPILIISHRLHLSDRG